MIQILYLGGGAALCRDTARDTAAIRRRRRHDTAQEDRDTDGRATSLRAAARAGARRHGACGIALDMAERALRHSHNTTPSVPRYGWPNAQSVRSLGQGVHPLYPTQS